MFMPRCLSVLTLSLSLFGIFASTASISKAETRADGTKFRALTGFSGSYDDVWSYGFGKTGTVFRYYNVFTYECVGRSGLTRWSSPLPAAYSAFVQINTSGTPFVFGDTTVAVTYGLMLHPGAGLQYSIVRWTSPAAGTHQFSGYFEILANCPSGVFPKIFVDSSDVTTTAFSGDDGHLTGPGANVTTLKHGQRKNFLFTRAVGKGNVISFGVNADGDFTCDTTGFDVTIEKIGP